MDCLVSHGLSCPNKVLTEEWALLGVPPEASPSPQGGLGCSCAGGISNKAEVNPYRGAGQDSPFGSGPDWPSE